MSGVSSRKLRRALDILPSPEADRPGLLLRDPLGYAEAVLYVPPRGLWRSGASMENTPNWT